jgi:hypothetical protein
LGVKHQGEFTVSALLLTSCAVFVDEQHAIPAVSACNRRASTQPCEFGAGHAFQSYPQILVLLSFFSDNRGAKFLKIFQKAETLPRFWNLKRRFKITGNWLAKLARNTCQAQKLTTKV